MKTDAIPCPVENPLTPTIQRTDWMCLSLLLVQTFNVCSLSVFHVESCFIAPEGIFQSIGGDSASLSRVHTRALSLSLSLSLFLCYLRADT